jgi:hypothetical protein
MSMLHWSSASFSCQIHLFTQAQKPDYHRHMMIASRLLFASARSASPSGISAFQAASFGSLGHAAHGVPSFTAIRMADYEECHRLFDFRCECSGCKSARGLPPGATYISSAGALQAQRRHSTSVCPAIPPY